MILMIIPHPVVAAEKIVPLHPEEMMKKPVHHRVMKPVVVMVQRVVMTAVAVQEIVVKLVRITVEVLPAAEKRMHQIVLMVAREPAQIVQGMC